MKFKKKILLIALTFILFICSSAVVFLAAADTPIAGIEIKSFSLSLENAVYMNFKVAGENVNMNSIKLLAWENTPAAYEKGTEDVCLNVNCVESDTGYAVFQYNDLAAKDMTKMIYVCAYAEVDGEEVYSLPAKFSIATYAYMKKNAAEPDTELVALLDGMLAYGAQAQTYFDCNEEWLATDAMGEVSVDGGTLPDGFSLGWYKAGTTVTLTADEPEEGYEFSHWENSAGEVVSESVTYEALIAEGNQIYTAVYTEKSGYSEGLKYSENRDGTYFVSGIGTCTDTEINIPPTYNGKLVTGIDSNAFYYCENITSVTIPNSVTSIGDSAFNACFNLRNVVIPNSVTSMGTGIFVNCNSLTSVKLPDGITSIGAGTFYFCTSLTSVTIPKSVTVIADQAFDGCFELKVVYYGGTATDWAGITIGGSNTNLTSAYRYYNS